MIQFRVRDWDRDTGEGSSLRLYNRIGIRVRKPV